MLKLHLNSEKIEKEKIIYKGHSVSGIKHVETTNEMYKMRDNIDIYCLEKKKNTSFILDKAKSFHTLW